MPPAARDPVSGDAAVWEVYQRGVEVHVLKEFLFHEAVVGVEILPLHREVLVQVEGGHTLEGEPFLTVHTDQLAIDPDRRGAGGQTQHRGPAFPLALADHLGDPDGHRTGQRLVAVEHRSAEALGGVHARNLGGS